MIGNDIVDIAYTRLTTDYRRKGYLEKIMNDHEQFLIKASLEPFLQTWRLWSMKESAYKIHANKVDYRIFNPSQFKCNVIDDLRGEVSIGSDKYFTQTELNDNYIFTQASENESTKIHHRVSELEQSKHKIQSQRCHSALLEAIVKSRILDRSNTEIIKNSNGKPEVYYNSTKLDIDISLTHHGMYAAYSYL